MPKNGFDMLRLKDCLIETYNLGHSPGTIRSLYEINKTSNIAVDTSVEKTSSKTVEEEEVKQEPYLAQLCLVHQHQE